LLLNLTSWIWLDLVIAVIFSFVILYMGVKLLRGALSGIMDEHDENLINQLLLYLETHKKNNWIDLHNLRIIKYGSSLHLDCHLRLPWNLNVKEAHKEIKEFEKLVKKKFEEIELFVHLNGCNENFCAHCIKKDCSIRKYKFKEFITWDSKKHM
jgi:divalent metal cation (Fe/Co/Zn/Cd) transporter